MSTKSSTKFQETIKAYLDKRAEEDELFKKTYSKENKSIEECCNYIIEEVQKSGINGFEDSEIFKMAVHYYDEDEIKATGKFANASVVINHEIELTEEEIEEEKERARQKVFNDQIEKMRSKKKPSKQKEVVSIPPSIPLEEFKPEGKEEQPIVDSGSQLGLF